MLRTTSMAYAFAGIALCVLLAGMLVGCGSTGASSATVRPTATATATPSPVPLIKVKTVTISRKHVQVLSDLNGKTLYFFKPDSSANVTCTGSCAQLWPPLVLSQGMPVASGTSLTGQLNVVAGADGRQVVYNGHPLYTYARDGDAGDAYGQGVGGEWFVATPGLAAQA